MMKAIEFETQYEEQLQETSPGNDFNFLDQVRLKTKGFQFDREEANAR